MKMKHYRKFGAGNPCAGHNSETILFTSICIGRALTDGTLGAVLDTGSELIKSLQH